MRWHCEDLGIRHVYIRPRSPNLNGKVVAVELSDIMLLIVKEKCYFRSFILVLIDTTID